MWAVVFASFLLLELSRVETFQIADCNLLSYDMRQRDCTIQSCTSAAASSCTQVSAQCWTCRFAATVTSQEGLLLQGSTDLWGNWQQQSSAISECNGRLDSGRVPCWYQPTVNQNMRFFLTLTQPTVSTSYLPVQLFSAATILFGVLTCCTAWNTAADSREVTLERMYALARQRALDAEIRPSRWAEMRDQEAWENDVGWLSPSQNPTGPAPASRRSQGGAAGRQRTPPLPTETAVVQNPMHGR